MTDSTNNQGHDARARAVAQAVYDAVRPVAVILFGSRARGDYRDDSDVDLLVITGDDADDRDIYKGASTAAHEKAREVYGRFTGVDVVQFTEGKFAYYRRARNHVAGQAIRHGVIVSEKPLEPGNQEPTNWPDVEQRFIVATRNLRGLETMVVHHPPSEAPQEIVGFLTQQSVENALKGWISALGGEYDRTHNLEGLIGKVRQYTSEENTLAGENLNWLTRYAVEYRYGGAVIEIADRRELLDVVADLVDAIAGRIKALTGSAPPRWTPE